MSISINLDSYSFELDLILPSINSISNILSNKKLGLRFVTIQIQQLKKSSPLKPSDFV